MGKIIGIFADGGIIGRNPSLIGGTWAYVGVDKKENIVFEHSGVLLAKQVAPLKVVSNNITELYALVRAIWNTPLDFEGTFYSDSQVTIQRVFKNAPLNGVPDFLAARLQMVKDRLKLFSKFDYCLLSGHPTKLELACGLGKRGFPCSKFNVHVDRLCRKLATDYLLDQESVGAPPVVAPETSLPPVM